MSDAFANRHVVIVGGSSGIGLATARAVLGHGGRVTIAGRDPERLHAACDELDSEEVAVVQADASDEASVRALFEAVGELDHVLVTAARVAGAPLAEISFDSLRDVVDARFWGALHVAKHARQGMRPGGSITLMSGNSGFKPAPGATVVAGSVGAIEGLVRALAVELAPLRVNCVRGGILDTPLIAGYFGADKDAVLARRAAGLPVGRVGTAEDIADAVVYLMGAGYATGTVLVVDGGALLV